MLPKYFAFFGAIIVLEDFLRLATYEFLPNFLAFFGAKIGGLETHDYTIFCPYFMPFLEPKVEDFLSLTTNRRRVPPELCLGVVCYTSWVKKWNKAMNFLQTFFPRQIFFYRSYQANIHLGKKV